MSEVRTGNIHTCIMSLNNFEKLAPRIGAKRILTCAMLVYEFVAGRKSNFASSRLSYVNINEATLYYSK